MTQVSTLGKLAVVTAGVLGIATACGSTSTHAITILEFRLIERRRSADR